MSDAKFILVLLWTAALALAVHYGVPGAVWVMMAMCGVWLVVDGLDEYSHGLERRPGNVPPAPAPKYGPNSNPGPTTAKPPAPPNPPPLWTVGPPTKMTAKELARRVAEGEQWIPARQYNRDAKGRFARKEGTS